MAWGAVILLIGIAIGWVGCLYAPRPRSSTSQKPYDKYKNKDGLYSRRTLQG